MFTVSTHHEWITTLIVFYGGPKVSCLAKMHSPEIKQNLHTSKEFIFQSRQHSKGLHCATENVRLTFNFWLMNSINFCLFLHYCSCLFRFFFGNLQSLCVWLMICCVRLRERLLLLFINVYLSSLHLGCQYYDTPNTLARLSFAHSFFPFLQFD